MRCKDCVCESINVGSEMEVSITKLAYTPGELFGSRSVRPVYSEPRAGDIRKSCADLNEARKLLGYKAKTSLREGVSLLLEGAKTKRL